MKKLFVIVAFAVASTVVFAQTQEPKQKEACCKKMANAKPGEKMKCSKDCQMPCCKKKTAVAKKAETEKK